MKKLMSLGIMALLVVTSSCKDQPEETEVEKQNIESREAVLAEETTKKNTDCYDEAFIHNDTAKLWYNSFVYAGEDILGTPIPADLEVRFPKDMIIELKRRTRGIDAGIRLYYILFDETERIPSLAMVLTRNCKADYEECDKKCVLFSSYSSEKNDIDGLQGWMDHNELKKYTKNWTKFIEGIDKFTVKVEGYNYAWTTIFDSMEVFDEFVVRYGVRTLGPGEIDEFKEKGKSDDTNDSDIIVGQPVLCNVIVARKEDQTTDEAFDETQEFDFAKPCPHFCD